jgi:hypothetical protein
MTTLIRENNRQVSQTRAVASVDVVQRVSEIVGYDIGETQAIEADKDLYTRVTTRLGTSAKTIPASEIFGKTSE